ncbi:T-cell surface glycoprotein CD5 [Sorex araneus]|uniref:T-cell surface glycoprotein CD5 n=1 Tax=Sorex araneus TaxID=42254 RepID=UPI0024338CC1|nr:T-cell surface glycoprotein CD5 [Sorex araneus]
MDTTSCLEARRWEDKGFQVALSGSPSLCQGQLKVHTLGGWHSVDNQSWDWHNGLQESLQQASKLCQKLDCGEALALGHFPGLTPPNSPPPVTCRGHVGSFARCNVSSSARTKPLGLICLEPPQKTPPPTSPPPTTTPAPTDPPRLLLVDAPGGLRCAGVLEVYIGGVIGSVLSGAPGSAPGLENRICERLQCGSFVKHLSLSGSLPIRWRMADPSCAFPEGCFLPVRPPASGEPLALLCSEFQPKVQSRLVGGSGPCAGAVEVRQDGQWATLCSSNSAKSRELWEEVCQEQKCGRLSSYREQDARGTTPGHRCPHEKLSQCHLLDKKQSCKRMFITCQDPNPAGLGAGSVMSIVLAVVLLAVLLAVCGPLAYKKLVKKFRQKKQRQWIGPTEMSQNMSFHRHHTATVRSSAVNPTAPHVENEYSQPPSSARSAYPALEGALRRVSTQPDNSSDSDYDLQVTQRL